MPEGRTSSGTYFNWKRKCDRLLPAKMRYRRPTPFRALSQPDKHQNYCSDGRALCRPGPKVILRQARGDRSKDFRK